VFCEVGWIRFRITAGDRSVLVCASCVWDPFPDLLSWLERIIQYGRDTVFTINEEGRGKTLSASPLGGSRWLFEVHKAFQNEPPIISTALPQRVLVASFYQSLRAFARSALYDRNEWTTTTVFDRFRVASSDLDDDAIIDLLCGFSREELRDTLFDANPTGFACVPDAKDRREELERWARHVLEPDNPKAAEGIVSVDVFPFIPPEYVTWPMNERRSFVRECLDEHVTEWGGSELDKLRSATIETYLTDGTELAPVG